MTDEKLTRSECEKLIISKLKEIVELYHQYNPNGTYLNAYYLEDENHISYSAFNRHYANGEDCDKPIDCTIFVEKEREEIPYRG